MLLRLFASVYFYGRNTVKWCAAAYLLPTLHSEESRWQLEIGCGGEIFTTEINKCYDSGLFLLGELLAKHLPAACIAAW